MGTEVSKDGKWFCSGLGLRARDLGLLADPEALRSPVEAHWGPSNPDSWEQVYRCEGDCPGSSGPGPGTWLLACSGVSPLPQAITEFQG